jgi:hypothetical protein
VTDLDTQTLFGEESAGDAVPWPHGYGSLTPASFTQRWPEGYGYLVGWPLFTASGGQFQRMSPWPWPEGYGHT